MNDAMLDNQDFIGTVVPIVKSETKTAVNIGSEKGQRHWKSVDAAYSAVA